MWPSESQEMGACVEDIKVTPHSLPMHSSLSLITETRPYEVKCIEYSLYMRFAQVIKQQIYQGEFTHVLQVWFSTCCRNTITKHKI